MNRFGVVDFHCDVLSKLLENDKLRFAEDGPREEGAKELDVTWERLRASGSLFQMFAIYIPERMGKTMTPILQSVDLFMRRIEALPGIAFVRTRCQLREALQNGKTGAMLSLEGVDGLQGDFIALRILYYLGVRALGLTWNHANWAADGVMEPRGGGLTGKGRQLVRNCNELGMMLDVSHLTDQGFWEVVELTNRPLIASHSNSRKLCPHPRNLTDDQIRTLVAMDGRIGITYVPWFVTSEGEASVSGVVRHVDHVCSLGGEKHVMLGSDFDGIDRHVAGLAHPGEVWRLTEQLLQHYKEEQVRGFMSENALRYLDQNLPD
ncbi:dipeptidase [Paenibacillus beijingensis]|uniref:Membrane dipeptidase n=1 Tax=Paenibacillus beijingensis TaxID=1126833 RepID=A0A0D5NNC5_9BACL|nr:dipeptidase [Paenibacillus beijingensis]AJY76640.1 membrane dipeptidase [Paenibacillus beijingensis]